MKIRNGFVSNSSTASFIINFSYTCNKDSIVDLLKQSSRWVEEGWEDWEAEPNIIFKESRTISGKKHGLKFHKNEASYITYTTMFNDWMDIDVWRFVRALSDERIPSLKLTSLIKTEEEYNTCHEEVKFDKYCWEYESYITNPWDNKVDYTKDIKEAKETQKDHDYEYLSYLSKINSPLTKEEELILVKGHLSKK